MVNKEFGQLLRRNGLFVTNPRLQVLRVLNEEVGPLSIEIILQKSAPGLALSTLYRVVADLLDAKLVKTFSSPDQKLMVELSDEQNEHHHHLYCTSCQRVFDVELDSDLEVMIENLVTKIGKTHGMNITEHSFELYGSCDNPETHLYKK
jgi:Fur family ferric uptake transcriptional regulator